MHDVEKIWLREAVFGLFLFLDGLAESEVVVVAVCMHRFMNYT